MLIFVQLYSMLTRFQPI